METKNSHTLKAKTTQLSHEASCGFWYSIQNSGGRSYCTNYSIYMYIRAYIVRYTRTCMSVSARAVLEMWIKQCERKVKLTFALYLEPKVKFCTFITVTTIVSCEFVDGQHWHSIQLRISWEISDVFTYVHALAGGSNHDFFFRGGSAANILWLPITTWPTSWRWE